MNKFLTFLAAFLVTASTFAQAPEKLSYQAVIRDAGNTIVSNQAVGMQISVLQTTATGTAVYVETQTPTTNANGLVSIEVGTGSTSDDFSAIDWSAGPYFIKTETDPTGGNSYTITGTSELLSVPYALHAKTAESVTSTCGLSIGDTYAGGIIFFLDGSGCHGLVAKATDETGFYKWSSTNFNTWAFLSGIYGGAQNTKKSIARAVASSSTCPAASVCDNLTSGGYTDWYLPSKDELDMMYVNLHMQGFGGFATNFYWSSTEYGNSAAWNQGFYDGLQYANAKGNGTYVRAVRAF
jgi:hypothetical protein